MIIIFNSIDDENSGFELLALTNRRFTYIGDHKIRINEIQHKILVANNAKFRIVKENMK